MVRAGWVVGRRGGGGGWGGGRVLSAHQSSPVYERQNGSPAGRPLRTAGTPTALRVNEALGDKQGVQ